MSRKWKEFLSLHNVKPDLVPEDAHCNLGFVERTRAVRGEQLEIFLELHPDVQYYDYTKIPNRKADYPNYHLTWSYSSANPKYEELFWDVIRKGMSVAVVFRKPIDMTTWRGYKVVDGDKDDLRFLDPKQSIVALYAKGRAKKDTSGFVVDLH